MHVIGMATSARTTRAVASKQLWPEIGKKRRVRLAKVCMFFSRRCINWRHRGRRVNRSEARLIVSLGSRISVGHLDSDAARRQRRLRLNQKTVVGSRLCNDFPSSLWSPDASALMGSDARAPAHLAAIGGVMRMAGEGSSRREWQRGDRPRARGRTIHIHCVGRVRIGSVISLRQSCRAGDRNSAAGRR